MNNPVAPKEGHYALLRNNEVTRPRPDQWANKAAFFDGLHHWWQDGTSVENCDAFDIIATISPADMQAVASGELERLRQEHAFMKDQIQKLDQIMTNSIKENDGPNRVNIDGVWYEGPVVENYFNVLRKMQEAYRLVLERVS